MGDGYGTLKKFTQDTILRLHYEVIDEEHSRYGVKNLYRVNGLLSIIHNGADVQEDFAMISARILDNITPKYPQPFNDCNHRTGLRIAQEICLSFGYKIDATETEYLGLRKELDYLPFATILTWIKNHLNALSPAWNPTSSFKNSECARNNLSNSSFDINSNNVRKGINKFPTKSYYYSIGDYMDDELINFLIGVNKRYAGLKLWVFRTFTAAWIISNKDLYAPFEESVLKFKRRELTSRPYPERRWKGRWVFIDEWLDIAVRVRREGR